MAADPLPADDRDVPQNIEAEQSVLGALLLAGGLEEELVPTWAKVAEVLKADDFYRDAHRTVYGAMAALVAGGSALDLVTLCDELGDALERVGGAAYLASLLARVPHVQHAQHYAKIVAETARLRALIAAGGQIAGLGYAGESAATALAQAQQVLVGLAARDGRGYRALDALLADYHDHFAALCDLRAGGGLPRTGIATGLLDLDKLTGGWQPGTLAVIAARPGAGKSSLLLQSVVAAAKGGIAGGFFTLEMSGHQLAERAVSAEAGIDSNELRTGWVDQEAREGVLEHLARLSDLKVYVDETPGLPLAELEAKATRMVAEDGVGLIAVDYIQLVTAPTKRGATRENEVSAISKGLLELARRLQVPVLVGCQLNRAVEQRPGHKPQLSDIRESGSIEQDAHHVIFLHREELYDPETTRKGITDAIVAKNRSGPTGAVQLGYHAPTTSFYDYTERER